MRSHCILWLYLLVGGTLLRGSCQEASEEATPEEGGKDKPAEESSKEEPAEKEEKEEPAEKEEKEESAEKEENEEGKKTECKDNEILTTNKGCVDRDQLIERVLLRTWADENLDYAKKKAGLKEEYDCKENEILTVFGCAERPYSSRNGDVQRVPVIGGRLVGRSVVHGGMGAAESEETQVVSNKRPGGHRPGSHGNMEEDEQGPVIGHNRRRKWNHLPGRLLKTGRRCRPYESVSRKGRCIRKIGKNGAYKHRNHYYGLQLRHRHEGISKTRRRTRNHQQ